MSKCQFTAILSFYDEKALKAGLETACRGLLPYTIQHNTILKFGKNLQERQEKLCIPIRFRYNLFALYFIILKWKDQILCALP